MAEPMMQVNVRVTPELYEALASAALRGNASVSDVIRKALRDYLTTGNGASRSRQKSATSGEGKQ